MTYYFIYRAEGPYAGANIEVRLKIDWEGSKETLLQYLDELGYQTWADNWESFGGFDNYDEVIEPEADYYFEEVSKDEYDNCGLNRFAESGLNIDDNISN